MDVWVCTQCEREGRTDGGKEREMGKERAPAQDFFSQALEANRPHVASHTCARVHTHTTPLYLFKIECEGRDRHRDRHRDGHSTKTDCEYRVHRQAGAIKDCQSGQATSVLCVWVCVCIYGCVFPWP